MNREPYVRTRLGQRQVVRPFTDAEDALITELRVAGWGTTWIATTLHVRLGRKRSPATINMRLKSLAAKEEADDEPL